MENPSETVNANKRIAAIDLGTNSFHAVLVDIYPDGSFRTVDKLKEMVILAEKGLPEPDMPVIQISIWNSLRCGCEA